MTVVEPEWDETDRAYALAYVEMKADTCSGCGHPLSESTHPDAEGDYEVPEPTRCHACTARSIYQDRYANQAHPDALLFESHRRRG